MNPCGISKRQEAKHLREAEAEQTLDEKGEIIGKFILVMAKFDKYWERFGGGDWASQKKWMTRNFVKAGLLPKANVKLFWGLVDDVDERWSKATGWGAPQWEASVAFMRTLLVDMRIHAIKD